MSGAKTAVISGAASVRIASGPDGGHALPAQVIKAVDEIGTLEPEEHERKFQIGAGEQKAILRAGGFDDGEHEVRLIFLQGVFP